VSQDRLDLAVRTDDARWEALGIGALAQKAILAVLDELGLERPVEASLLATDDEAMKALNTQFRGKENATNVLSWPAEPLAPPIPGKAPPLPLTRELGDIALGYETCMAEAASAGIPREDHVTHLVVHGCFHLLGYDHETDADAALMEGLEAQALAKLGIGNPY